ncbi:site-specific DNA-methyltransferase [Microbacterium sp. C448]|uniref:site-specific DNA-methyltransferase n=1 Tax=Microbacterium sp. C448 TaxID=1177594 RepID=UPI0004B1FB65|nr:site-specific DNA-methyltransferase [Microbacterium sp. C448]
MTSPDLTRANIDKIADLFPTVVTETLDADGEPTRAVDFDLLRQELSDHIVEGPQERYQLDWPGKRAAAFAANAPIAKTLRPVREESVEFDTTRNLFIEGDNLDALKLLQESYLGKVNLIFIDPPYNTGSDRFTYPDDFAVTNADYLARSGQTDDRGLRLQSNMEANGRFHSDWLSMMYPRLRLARNLLSPDGLLCVAIDDNEGSALDAIGREVFGERNFVAKVIWKHTEQSKNDEPYFSRHHNYLVMFRRGEDLGQFRLPRTEADNRAYSNPDNDPRGAWRSGDVRSPSPRPSLRFTVETPSGKVIAPPENGWRWSKESIKQKIASGEIVFRDGDSRLVRKIYLEDQVGRTPETVWSGDVAGTTRQANAEIKELFGATIFDTPKPTRLIRRVLELLALPNALVLDFFAGSASTADAVISQNAADGGKRRFIMVQLPEPCDPGTEAAKAGFRTIADIGKERIRRAGARFKDRRGVDTGFRALRVDTTNMLELERSADDLVQTSLAESVDSVKSDRTDEDLLFQVLLDWGLDVAEPITIDDFDRRRVLVVADGALVACFADDVTVDLVRRIAEKHPLRAVFKDSGFSSDAARINAEQIFREVSPETEVRAI